jgi:hypothetical protein
MKRVSLLLISALMISVLPVLANPIVVQTDPLALQDDWLINGPVEELGVGFPPAELIGALDVPWEGHIPCPVDYKGLQNVQVEIVNLTGKIWTELYYVADPETSLSNVDELLGDVAAPGFTPAFKIDRAGLNTPLVFESMTQDGVFEIGETWQFVIQEYSNGNGLPPSAMGSLGVSFASAGLDASSGSIIAIPEPSVVGLLAISGLGLFIRKRLML